jgi:hypothetical protein
MEDEISSLISKLNFIRTDVEKEIISCLVQNCIQQKNISAEVDYIAISNYTKKKGYANNVTVDALTRLTSTYLIPVRWERIKINGTPQKFEYYSINDEIGILLKDYMKKYETK